MTVLSAGRQAVAGPGPGPPSPPVSLCKAAEAGGVGHPVLSTPRGALPSPGQKPTLLPGPGSGPACTQPCCEEDEDGVSHGPAWGTVGSPASPAASRRTHRGQALPGVSDLRRTGRTGQFEPATFWRLRDSCPGLSGWFQLTREHHGLVQAPRLQHNAPATSWQWERAEEGPSPSLLPFPSRLLLENPVLCDSSDSAPASSWRVVITLYPSPPPPHVWPCPGAPPCAFTRVPGACGLTPSAGSEMSLRQVNCQTAQSLKLNIKAVARGHRAISPLPQQKAILAVQAEGRWIPWLGAAPGWSSW